MVEKIKKVKKKLRSPSAFTVLFVVIALMAALTWVIPSGHYKLDKDGNRESGTYSKVDKQKIVDLDDSGEPKKTMTATLSRMMVAKGCGMPLSHRLKVCLRSLMLSCSFSFSAASWA